MTDPLTDKKPPPISIAVGAARKRGLRSTSQILRDRHRLMRLYAKGVPAGELPSILGRSARSIKDDLENIKEAWAQSGLFDFSTAIAVELQKITEIEVQYTQSWLASLRPKSTLTIQKLADGTVIETHKEEASAGDPRFLEGIRWCVQKRSELLGLDAPKKFKVNVSAELISYANELGLTASHILTDPVLRALFQQTGADMAALSPPESAGMGRAEKVEAPAPGRKTAVEAALIRARALLDREGPDVIEGDFTVADPPHPSSVDEADKPSVKHDDEAA